MEQHLASLSKRQAMLLLTAVTFGGPDGVAMLEGLPDEEAELLKHRAAQMLQMSREKRVPLLVQQIKRLLGERRRQLTSADAAQLAALLQKERPALVEVILRALPSHLADTLRERLRHAPVKLSREVRPEVLSIIRWKLESLLTARVAGRGVFHFTDVLWVASRELATLCDRMGARALATALAGLPEDALTAFSAALPPDLRVLAQKAASAGKARPLPEDKARALLEAHGGFQGPEGAMRSAGAQRVVRACLAESPDFATRLLERHPGDLGRLFSHWVREERPRPVRGDGGRADIVEQLERLAEKGLIDRPLRLAPPPNPPDAELPGGRLLPPPTPGPNGRRGRSG